MVLAAAVTDRRGRRLIPAEVELTERHIQALQMWGVPHVEVEGDSPDEPLATTLAPEVEERIRAEVDERFGDADRSHPFTSTLYDWAVNRAMTIASSGGGSA